MSDRVGVRLVLLWAVVTACGFAILLRYKNTPTPNDGLPPERWPAETRLAPASDRATLVLFTHPHCACTHASVSELARLTARVSDRLAVRIVIVSPPGVRRGWDDTELARRAGLVAGAELRGHVEPRELAQERDRVVLGGPPLRRGRSGP